MLNGVDPTVIIGPDCTYKKYMGRGHNMGCLLVIHNLKYTYKLCITLIRQIRVSKQDNMKGRCTNAGQKSKENVYVVKKKWVIEKVMIVVLILAGTSTIFLLKM